jgi:hypothetical protein
MLTCYTYLLCLPVACRMWLNMECLVSRNKSRSYYIPYNLFLDSTHS